MWYLTPGRAMQTTITEASNEPKTAEMKECCHVKPVEKREAPVFQPVSENWLENQNSGRLYLQQALA